MTYYNPPHDAINQMKVDRLVAAMQQGQALPPIVVYGCDALTGAHRIEAHRQIGENAPPLETVEIDDDLYLAACELLGIEARGETDPGSFVTALHVLADNNQDLRAALDDQIDPSFADAIKP